MRKQNNRRQIKKMASAIASNMIAEECELQPDFNPQRKQLPPVQALTESQGDFIAHILRKQITFGVGPAGTGKAQPLDAKILTPAGWKTMGDMKVGSKVFTADGSITEVVGVFPQGEKDIYRITLSDGRSAECCKEHLWNVILENGRKTMSLEEMVSFLNSKKRSRMCIQLPLAIEYQEKDFRVHPYLLGALLGDGCLRLHSVLFSNPEKEILDKISGLLDQSLVIKPVNSKSSIDHIITKKTMVGQGQKNVLLDQLRDLGLCGKLSYEKFIPEEYMTGSIEQRKELLQGLMDTDGYADKSGSTSYSTTSYQLALQVQELARGLGNCCRLIPKQKYFTYKGGKKPGRPSYNLNIRSPKPSELFTLARKKERVSDNNQYAATLKLAVKSIELVRKAEAQCIMVADPSHLYITDEYTVTHNTYCATALACDELEARRIQKIVITRPMLGCEEDIGFLPGEQDEKFLPWVKPFMDVFYERFGKGRTDAYVKSGRIEMAPLMMMRGSSFNNCWVILDEAQNVTPGQMKMFLTRVGDNAKLIITGDLNQSDLKDRRGVSLESGLHDAVNKFKKLREIGITHFFKADIVRSGIVRQILDIYEPCDAYEN